eukprot:scaffold10561_cov152-Chaetoceros_neogracile.AAC.1
MNHRPQLSRKATILFRVLACVVAMNLILSNSYKRKDMFLNNDGSPNDHTIHIDVIADKEEEPMYLHPAAETTEFSMSDHNVTLTASSTNATTTFKHYDGVVIFTKVLHPLCLKGRNSLAIKMLRSTRMLRTSKSFMNGPMSDCSEIFC